jgi:hypothetical protein
MVKQLEDQPLERIQIEPIRLERSNTPHLMLAIIQRE